MDSSLASPSPRAFSRLDAGLASPSPDVGLESAPSGFLFLSPSHPIIHPSPAHPLATTAADPARSTRLRSTPSAPLARRLGTTSNSPLPPADLRDSLPRRSTAPPPCRPGSRLPVASRHRILPHPELAEGARFHQTPTTSKSGALAGPSPTHNHRRTASPLITPGASQPLSAPSLPGPPVVTVTCVETLGRRCHTVSIPLFDHVTPGGYDLFYRVSDRLLSRFEALPTRGDPPTAGSLLLPPQGLLPTPSAVAAFPALTQPDPAAVHPSYSAPERKRRKHRRAQAPGAPPALVAAEPTAADQHRAIAQHHLQLAALTDAEAPVAPLGPLSLEVTYPPPRDATPEGVLSDLGLDSPDLDLVEVPPRRPVDFSRAQSS